MREKRRYRQPVRRGTFVAIGILSVLLVLVVAGILLARYTFAISEITIEGSSHYSYEQLYAMLFENRNDSNMLLYQYTDRKQDPVEIPFVAKIDREIEYPDKIHFTIYEKSMVGYVVYMGTNMYFDKDGVIVECSYEKMEDVPLISGLDYSNIVMHQALDVSNPGIFSEIQNLKQYLDKYGIYIDEIIVTNNQTFSIRLDEVVVLLGNQEDSFSDKIYALSCLQDKLYGMNGTLDMSIYRADGTYVFVSDEEKADSEDESEAEAESQNASENATEP